MDGKDASSLEVRRAHARAHLLSHSSPVVEEEELLVGKPCYRPLDQGERAELDGFRRTVAPAQPRLQGQGSHMAVDYPKLLRLGVRGVREEARNRLDGLDREDPRTLDRAEFYRACLVALEGVLVLAARYAEVAREAGRPEIAAILERVPSGPAASFREALQSVHFLTFCLEGLYQLGRPDRYLIDRYRNDLESGRLTPEEAQELIDCLCILFSTYVPRGLAVGFMVGGADAEGHDLSNELTTLFIESIEHTAMIYPGIGLCVTPDTPPELLARSAEILGRGRTHPALFNDQTITRGLRSYGLSPEEACQYVHSTCVEITPVACSAVWVASPYINLVEPLLEMLGVPKPVEAQSYATFDELTAAYRGRLASIVRRETIEQNRQQMERFHHGGDALVSCFVNDCLERGLDVDRGGARYNWIMPSFVGLANLVDSFAAIRSKVFREGSLDWAGLREALASDFAGNEPLRLSLLNAAPKYGNDDDEVDSLATTVTGWIREEVSRYRTYRGDRFVPSLFCWIMHERLGSVTAATPDGRRCGFPLGDGSGPAQGRERKGPTAAILSATKWEHAPFIGGIAVNMRFRKSLFAPASVGKLTDLVRTFMTRGGFELQVNCLDQETLRKARERPEAYRDLVVRIGGYSDYFVKLPPAMQEELILRTEHRI